MYHANQSSILIENLDGTCSAGGALVLESNPRRDGGVLTFDIVATRTPTANAIVAIEIVLGSTVFGIRTLKMANADYWYKTRGPVRIASDGFVRLTFSDAGASKLCEATVYGYVVYPE